MTLPRRRRRRARTQPSAEAADAELQSDDPMIVEEASNQPVADTTIPLLNLRRFHSSPQDKSAESSQISRSCRSTTNLPATRLTETQSDDSIELITMISIFDPDPGQPLNSARVQTVDLAPDPFPSNDRAFDGDEDGEERSGRYVGINGLGTGSLSCFSGRQSTSSRQTQRSLDERRASSSRPVEERRRSLSAIGGKVRKEKGKREYSSARQSVEATPTILRVYNLRV